MKKILFGVGTLLLCNSALKAQKSHVVLISIDGLRPEFYKLPAIMASWMFIQT